MRPVNFIKLNNKGKDFTKIILNKKLMYICPVLLLIMLLGIDYVNLKNKIPIDENYFVEEKEIQLLKKEANEYEEEIEVLSKWQQFYFSLSDKKVNEKKIVDILKTIEEIETENIFATNISYEENITIIGNSIDKESIYEWKKIFEENNIDMSILELNFSNGFYSFTMIHGGDSIE